MAQTQLTSLRFEQGVRTFGVESGATNDADSGRSRQVVLAQGCYRICRGSRCSLTAKDDNDW